MDIVIVTYSEHSQFKDGSQVIISSLERDFTCRQATNANNDNAKDVVAHAGAAPNVQDQTHQQSFYHPDHNFKVQQHHRKQRTVAPTTKGDLQVDHQNCYNFCSLTKFC